MARSGFLNDRPWSSPDIRGRIQEGEGLKDDLSAEVIMI